MSKELDTLANKLKELFKPTTVELTDEDKELIQKHGSVRTIQFEALSKQLLTDFTSSTIGANSSISTLIEVLEKGFKEFPPHIQAQVFNIISNDTTNRFKAISDFIVKSKKVEDKNGLPKGSNLQVIMSQSASDGKEDKKDIDGGTIRMIQQLGIVLDIVKSVPKDKVSDIDSIKDV